MNVTNEIKQNKLKQDPHTIHSHIYKWPILTRQRKNIKHNLQLLFRILINAFDSNYKSKKNTNKKSLPIFI